MKNLFFGLIATVLFSITGFANTTSNDSSMTSFVMNKFDVKELVKVDLTTDTGEKVSLTFNSYEEFENANLNEIVKELTNNDPSRCTASVSVEVGVGVASVTVSFSVEVDCADLVSATVGLYKKAKAAIAQMI